MSELNEWGVPDWRKPENYGSTEGWSRDRWRWEFIRRRADVRAAFDEGAEDTYRYLVKFAGMEGFPAAHLRPDEPGFTVAHPLALEVELPRLPNPRIGDQDSVLAFRDASAVVHTFNSEQPPDGFERFDFDLSKPIEPQIETARHVLKELQVIEHGKLIQKRRHPKKWLTYLRVLDGREAGASWRELTVLLPHRNGSEQSARDVWQQATALQEAEALRFNF